MIPRFHQKIIFFDLQVRNGGKLTEEFVSVTEKSHEPLKIFHETRALCLFVPCHLSVHAVSMIT